ncbi:myoferlin-like [Octopus sinensis]|uniref:Myoferlin-like n=1 Tax=Octopus sinensis TaxID=2607531 RepID=A0A6P7U063_9MOLL|nr:myoferlin-like [Octopus sinensis]
MLAQEIDWWSKYYASEARYDKCKGYLQHGFDTIIVGQSFHVWQIYNQQLENSENYDKFRDFCDSFQLTRGKTNEDEESTDVGEFKVDLHDYIQGLFNIIPLKDGDFVSSLNKTLSLWEFPYSTFKECIVRVYIVKAMDLQSRDLSGLVIAKLT